MLSDLAERVESLIEKGEQVLSTHSPNPQNVIGFPTLDSSSFDEWRTQSLSFLSDSLGSGHVYTNSFDEKTEKGAYKGAVNSGLGILKAVKEDIQSGDLSGNSQESFGQDPLLLLEQICSRFHLVARQLRDRYEDRETLSVTDEYDVQDLFHALLKVHFDDIRPEEYTPSYAGKGSRVDFLLKMEQIIVETKKSRESLTEKELGTQLIDDIERYEEHPNCNALVCFVYDPDGFIGNPRGVENDLERDEPFPVRVFIRPKL